MDSAAGVVVAIPTLNEAHSIGDVVRGIPRDVAGRIIVADGGSHDATVARAKEAGAEVIHAGRGYGRACLAAAMAAEGAGIVVFMDGDGADDPQAISSLIEPILSGVCDFVIGSRARGRREPGSIAWHQLAAGHLAGWGMRLLYGVRYTDMCAFRAIRRDALLALGMREQGYGWNIEMQMRAARAGLRIREIPVDYRRRSGGHSKVAGSLPGTIRAGARIIATFARVSSETRSRTRHAGLAILLCSMALVAPAIAQARDLVVYGEPTLEKALRSVGQLWQARTGTRVNVFVASTTLSLAQIERGARCDVIFALAGAATDDAARDKIIHAGTVRRALRNDLVLIGADPAAAPPGDTTPADLSKLIAGKTLAIADPARDAGGARAVDLLRSAGISVDGNRSITVAESSAGVVSMLAAGKARLGIVYATDATRDFVVGLPTSGLPPIDYVVAQARDPVMDTQPFLAFLQSAPAKAAFQSAGLQPIDDASAGRQ
ncbi:MAG TPA: molybdate ABC transporter substrate-binding protein [Xanthobacteraceae bacterium]|nr:molybdate ABC transporter substrate-binding protein [Xanthobacteraceae bacterium]